MSRVLKLQISSVNLMLKTLQELCNMLRVKFKFFTLICSTCEIHLLTPLLLSPLGLAYTAWRYLHKPLLHPAFFSQWVNSCPSIRSQFWSNLFKNSFTGLSEDSSPLVPGSWVTVASHSTRTSFYMYLCDMIGPCPSPDVIRPSVSWGQWLETGLSWKYSKNGE